MVGSGFSRNATTTSSDAHIAPTWADLAEALYVNLYPKAEYGDIQSAPAQEITKSHPTRLAQEYATSFGRDHLHRFIRQQVQNTKLAPGDLHYSLMRLPWRDVFTTNWDTLLEKTRKFVPENNYSIVRNSDEIPLAPQPRIIKLHGTLPAHFPLIFTEEDYRTYPINFAPFVNTVQQAMMETVFILIGFSGDDPNFLNWSGWVRDNLGTSAPKIYLAGWLNLSNHRRRMLEHRNVIPIDLYRHPKSQQWPEHLKHQYSTEWLLASLHFGKPYVTSKWPEPPTGKTPKYQEIIRPIEEPISEAPMYEADLPTEVNKLVILNKIQKLLSVWQHNRKLYPNWLVIPHNKICAISKKTRNCRVEILENLSNLEPVTQLKAVYELIWRTDILLEPISEDLEIAATEVMNKIDCTNRTIDGKADITINWAVTRKDWLYVALALATAARLKFKQQEFKAQIEKLLPFLSDNKDVSHRIKHECCLSEINSLNYSYLDELLNTWDTDDSEPVWMMRKAAVLFETGRHEDAKKLITSALAIIRAYPKSDRSVVGPSCEGWALYSALDLGELESELEPWSRWEELAPLKCNAYEEMQKYTRALDKANPDTFIPSFDFDKAPHRRFTFSNDENEQYLAAFRANRLTEVAGLPSSTGFWAPALEILTSAAEKLFLREPELAARLILRITKNETGSRFNAIFSRTRVAAMPVDLVVTLAQDCSAALEFTLTKIIDPGGTWNGFWVDRLRVLMEGLSRFVVRLEPKAAKAIFDNAMKLYQNRIIASRLSFAKPMHNILNRSWDTLPESIQSKCVSDVLLAQIAGIDDFPETSEQYPDPGYLLRYNSDYPDIDIQEDQRKKILGFLVRALISCGEARERALHRVSWMYSRGLIAKSEETMVATALWGDEYASYDGLPRCIRTADWGFLALPEPEKGIAEKRFRKKWLNTEVSSVDKIPDTDTLLFNVGSAVSGLRTHNRSLMFSDREIEFLGKKIFSWAKTPIPYPSSISVAQSVRLMYQNEVNKTFDTISGLKSVLLEVDLSNDVAKALYDKFVELNKTETPAFTLAPGLIKSLPDLSEDIAQSMRIALVSGESPLALDAAEGLSFWLDVSRKLGDAVRPPPDDLVREVGIIIASRRKPILNLALQIAKMVFSDGEQRHQGMLGDLLSQGLGYLAQELRYDGNHDQTDDVPLLRWGCTHLAIAMAEQGFDEDDNVAFWVNGAEADPLPEVRHAKRPTDKTSY